LGREERRRIEATKGSDSEPLSVAERKELIKLRKEVAEREKDLAFLKKATAYFAANQQN
jgi:transposase-like protein